MPGKKRKTPPDFSDGMARDFRLIPATHACIRSREQLVASDVPAIRAYAGTREGGSSAHFVADHLDRVIDNLFGTLDH